MDDKENTAPLQLGSYGDAFSFSPFKKDDLKARSKSIGPGDLQNTLNLLRERRQSINNTLVKGILPDKEDAERKAARRRSMANRRVSFAPEATLHTWDVIARDHTTSTDDTQSTRPSPKAEGASDSFGSPASQLTSDDGSADTGSEDELEVSEGEDEDATGTAMSLISDAEITEISIVSGGSSTSSSLDRNLRLAAEMAGTRGIEYDEFGEMSMEFANEEITNAFQPWVQQESDERRGSAAYDQENMNPFVNKPLIELGVQELTADASRAGSGINTPKIMSSPFNETVMDMTQPLGGIKSYPQCSPQKRPRPDDTPASGPSPAKRARSRYSLASNQTAQWDATMDFTQALGGIHAPSEISFDGNEELSMELTGVIGGISRHLDNTYRQAPPEASSPFRVDADDTITRLVVPDMPIEDAQSPTPRAKGSSTRRSSARLRRVSMNEAQAEALLESSPTQRRSSRRLSAKSPVPQPQLGTEGATVLSTPVQALTKMQLGSAKQKSPKSASKSPRSVTRSPHQPAATPPQPIAAAPSTPPAPPTASKSITDGIKLMTTPRKEFLKPTTPKRATPSPSKRPRSIVRSQPRLPDIVENVAYEEVAHLVENTKQSGIHLQDFLDRAGIRFMELTTSKRRLTVATTPSRLRQTQALGNDVEDVAKITLEEAIVAAACTEPELELYKHACHELKRYIDEGKADMKILEAETYKETPLLVQAYMAGDEAKRAILDAQMRDVKVNARLRSKEMWYGWRSDLVDDLMKALQSIAEDLIADDELLQNKESVLADTLPPLQQHRTTKRAQIEELFAAVPRDEDKAELTDARERLAATNTDLREKRHLLQQMQSEARSVEERREELGTVKDEHLLTIRAADQLRAEKEVVSGDHSVKLRNAVRSLEDDYEWSVIAASSNPPTVTMTYKSQLQLFFHPSAFNRLGADSNAPISLTYIAKEDMSTTARFVLQLLKAHLQAMSQAATKVSDLLNLVADSWEIALQLLETERLLSIEGPVKTAIVSDNCLAVNSLILLPAVKTKVCALFNVYMTLEAGSGCDTTTQKSVKVVYGEPYNEKNMSEFLSKQTDSGFESWPSAVQQLRQKLIERGPKTTPAKSC